MRDTPAGNLVECCWIDTFGGQPNATQPGQRAGEEADAGARDQADREHDGAEEPLVHRRPRGSMSDGLRVGSS